MQRHPLAEGSGNVCLMMKFQGQHKNIFDVLRDQSFNFTNNGRTFEGHFVGWDESMDFEGSFNTVHVKYQIGINLRCLFNDIFIIL